MKNLFVWGAFLTVFVLGPLGFLALFVGAGKVEFDSHDPTPPPVQVEAVPAAQEVPQAVPVESVDQSEEIIVTPTGVVALATERTIFRSAWDADTGVQIPAGVQFNLQFELTGHPGWYGVEVGGLKGFVRMGEVDLPDGLYTQADLRIILPWGEWSE